MLNKGTLADLYPELTHHPGAEAQAFAYQDLAYTLLQSLTFYAQTGRRFFYRLGEMFHYSNLQAANPEQIQNFPHWIFICTQQAAEISPSPENLYNLKLLTWLMAAHPSQRAPAYQELLHALTGSTVPAQIPQLHHTFAQAEDSILDHYVAKKALHTLPFLINHSLQAHFKSTPVSSSLRALAFHRLATLLWGSTPLFEHISWRTGLIKALLEAEYPSRPSNEYEVFDLSQDPVFFADARKSGWSFQDTPQDGYDIACYWGEQMPDPHTLQQAFDHLREKGLLIVGVTRHLIDPEVARQQLQSLTGCNSFIIEREAFSNIVVVYLFKQPKWEPQYRALIVMRPDSVMLFGGADYQMFRSRAYFKDQQVHTDITLSYTLNPDTYQLVFVVGYLHETYKIEALRHLQAPILGMPISTLYQEQWAISEILYSSLRQHLASIPSEQQAGFLREYLGHLDLNTLKTQVHTTPWISQMQTQLEQQLTQLDVCTFYAPQAAKELYPILSPTQLSTKPYRVISNGCILQLFEKADAQLFKSQYFDQDFIITIGRLEPNKNILGLCAALALTPYPLVIVAPITTPEEEIYYQLCLTASNGKVMRVENLSQTMLASAIKAARIFVLPSASEVAPLSAIEAASTGTAVVLTENSVLNELFGDSITYIQPFDIQNMQQQITTVWNDHSDKRQRALEIVTAECSWEKMGHHLAQLIIELCEQSTAPCTDWNGILKPLAHAWPTTLSECSPNWVYTLTDISRLLSSNLDSEHKQNLNILAQTPLQYHFLCQHHWKNVHLAPTAIHSSPLQPQHAGKRHFLTYYAPHNLSHWQESLHAFIQTFQPADPVALYLYVANPEQVTEEDIYAEVLGYIEQAGIDPEAIPDVQILMDPETPPEELFQQIQIGIFLPAQYAPDLESVYALMCTLPQRITYPALHYMAQDLPIHGESPMVHELSQAMKKMPSPTAI